MKQLLAIFGTMAIFSFFISCTGSGSTAAASAADSAAAARAAKDSILAKNKETALNAVKKLSLATIDEAFKDVTTDAVDYGDGSMKPVRGIDSIKAGLKPFLAAFPDMKGGDYTVIGDGNMVAVFGEYTGTFTSAFMGMKPTGKAFKVRDVDLFTFNDAGKMTEHRNIQSGMTYFNQVGAKMK